MVIVVFRLLFIYDVENHVDNDDYDRSIDV